MTSKLSESYQEYTRRFGYNNNMIGRRPNYGHPHMKDLVLWLPGFEGAGRIIPDYSLYNHSAEATFVDINAKHLGGQAAPGWWFENSDNEYIRVANRPSLQVGPTEGFLCTCRVFVRNMGVGTNPGRVANNRGTGAGSSFAGWQFKIQEETGSKWSFKDCSISDALTYVTHDSGIAGNLFEWYFIAMEYDRYGERLRFYINDQKISVEVVPSGFGSLTNNLSTFLGIAGANAGSEGPLAQPFDGFVGDFRFYKTNVNTSTATTAGNHEFITEIYRDPWAPFKRNRTRTFFMPSSLVVPPTLKVRRKLSLKSGSGLSVRA